MKKIIDLYKSSSKPIFSFEFFPPKSLEGELKLKQVISELKKLNPAFVSVTYGAGGSTRDKTIELCAEIQTSFSILSMCHFTCVGFDEQGIFNTLKLIESKNIYNVIALRGDPPKGSGKFVAHPNGFANATELIQFIRKQQFPFCLAGGCYPEKHPDAPTLEIDIQNLKKKVDAGAEFLITQLFFSNPLFYKFRDMAVKQGIHVPIIPGIMPITSFSQIERFKELANCEIPNSLIKELEAVKDQPQVFLTKSIEFTVNQCKDLLANEVLGIHFYTLNQSNATIEVMKFLA
jgi:methylenetetrahydrofolate reductase (NADPH)